MKQYIGTKSLLAQPMTRGEYNVYRGWTLPEGENPDDHGYLVEYQNDDTPNHPDHRGYISWSPKLTFEEAYQESGNLSFGHALVALKDGKKVARKGWNGKGMFAYLVPANSYPVQTGAAASYFGAGSLVPYRAYLALKTVDDDVATWAPSCSDVLASDWTILPE